MRELAAPSGSTILDVGCGPGLHAIRLARRGFAVDAVDFSPAVLELAREHVRAAGFDDRVTIADEDLLDLSFPDGSRRYVLCWGVLMHVPDVARAVSELSRVLAPGGTIVVSENNVRSLQSRGVRLAKRLRRHELPELTSFGAERWTTTDGGTLLTREADVDRLVTEFGLHGVVLARRTAAQFTEAYVKAPAFLERPIHAFNRLWFDRVRLPGPAAGNLLFLTRRG